MRTDWRVVVLGLGGIGSGALYWLSRAAAGDILGVEQYELGHSHGGSQDHSRIIRYSYHTPHYVELAAGAYRAWAEVEREADERLIHRCGGLDLFPADGAIPFSGYGSSLEARGVPFERLQSDEIGARWPQFRNLEGVTGLYQQDGGLVAAARATAAHQRLARTRGAEIREGVTVESVRQIGDEVEVTLGGIRHRTQQLVVTAGAWSSRVLGQLGVRLPLEITQEQVTYFDTPRAERFGIERFPVWIWMDEPCFYGLPVFGERGVKVAQDVGGEPVTAETRDFTPNAETLDRCRAFLDRHLPDALGDESHTKTCLYTLTPDRDFVVDRVAQAPRVWVAIGAGHAFKFASLLGRCLSELALDRATDVDLTPFRITRPILSEESPPKHYMV